MCTNTLIYLVTLYVVRAYEAGCVSFTVLLNFDAMDRIGGLGGGFLRRPSGSTTISPSLSLSMYVCMYLYISLSLSAKKDNAISFFSFRKKKYIYTLSLSYIYSS